MPQDVITLHALSQELADALVGGRIDRITQPERDEVCFFVRAKGVNHCLVVSVNPNAPRMHLTTTKKDNPYAAPAFLMHLRRHTQGGMIQSIDTVNYDRIVRISILGRNEMHDAVSVCMYIELMGRYSNVIVVDNEGRITDALRHIPPAENQLRAVLPHLAYTLPPQTKICPDDREGIALYLSKYSGGDLVKYLFGGVAGMVNITARELVDRAGLADAQAPLSPPQIDALVGEIDLAYHVYDSNQYAPAYGIDEDGNYVDYYVYPYRTTANRMAAADSLNAAANLCHDAKDKALRLKAGGKHLCTIIGNAIKKQEKLLAIAEQKILDCRDNDALRIQGELITSNLYRLSKGMATATLYDYYNDCDVVIPLDVNLSPADNAQAYYKRYAKQKRTVAIAEKQVAEYRGALEYLLSVKASFDMAEDVKELGEIEQELVQNGFLPTSRSGAKVRKPQATSPQRYFVDGYTILRGKNNLQNEALTFHTAKETDVWLHVKAAHGSHVIISSEGRSIPDSVLLTAAEIAAYYSDERVGGKVSVDYAPRKQVRHHPSRKCGMVIYTEYKTITVVPKGHKEYECD